MSDGTARAIVSPVAATATSENADPNRPVELSIDQSGLGAGFESGVDRFDDVIGGLTHAPNGADEWFTAEGVTTATVTYDLGATYDVDRIALWNEDSAGIAGAELSVSTDGVSFAPVGTIAPENNQIGSYGAEVFDLGFTGRFLRLDITDAPQEGDSNQAFFSERAAIGEIAVSARPAPATDRAAFLGALDRAAVIDFADVDTSGPDPVSILPDRYADLGVIIDGDMPGARDGFFVDEDFGFPDQFSGPETANTAAPANTTARVTFTPEAGGAARAFGATFIDADFPGIAQAQFIARDTSGEILLEEEVTTGDGDAQFVGLSVPDGAPGIAEVLLVGGNGFPANPANEGVVFDDLVVGFGADADIGPSAEPDNYATTGFTPLFGLDPLANDAGATRIVAVDPRTEGGIVALDEDGTLDYAPRRGFSGTDSFTYTVEDAAGAQATGTVSIEVAPIDPALEIARFTGYLYETGLGRFPKTEGLNFWAQPLIEGRRSEERVANDFLTSPEFAAKFGAPDTLSDRELVETLFRNQLGRDGAEAGIDFWEGNLARPGFSREDLLIAFAESPENQLNAPGIADIRQRADGRFDFGLELGASAGAVSEGETLTYTLETAADLPDGATFEIVFAGDDLDETAATADPLDDLGTRDATVVFPAGTVAGDRASFDITPIADARSEGDEGLGVSVRDEDGIELARTTTLLRDGGNDGGGDDGSGEGGGGDGPDEGGGGDGSGEGGGGDGSDDTGAGVAASWSLTVSTEAADPGFDVSDTTSGTAGQLTDPAGDALINLDRVTNDTEESVWVITDPDLPEISASPQGFEADLIQLNTVGPGGFPLVVANLDPFSSAQPPAELTLERVTTDVIEGSLEARIFDPFGTEYDVEGTFVLPNEALELG